MLYFNKSFSNPLRALKIDFMNSFSLLVIHVIVYLMGLLSRLCRPV